MDSLNSPGGHIVVSLILIGVGLGTVAWGAPHGNDITVFALGVLSRSMMDTPKQSSITTQTPNSITTATTGDVKQ